MRTIHIIVGSRGEYSDRTVWTVAAYQEQDAARMEVERLDACWRVWCARADADDDYAYSDDCIADAKAIDPGSDPTYGGYNYRPDYHIEEVELR